MADYLALRSLNIRAVTPEPVLLVVGHSRRFQRETKSGTWIYTSRSYAARRKPSPLLIATAFTPPASAVYKLVAICAQCAQMEAEPVVYTIRRENFKFRPF